MNNTSEINVHCSPVLNELLLKTTKIKKILDSELYERYTQFYITKIIIQPNQCWNIVMCSMSE